MNDIPTGGGRANSSGKELEAQVEFMVQRRGYKPFIGSPKEMLSSIRSIRSKQYGKQVPCGTTIYGDVWRSDLFLVDPIRYPDGLTIECKWQQSGGSVDEKYPFLSASIQHTEIPAYIILDGGGMRKRAYEWLKSQQGGHLLGIYTISEFIRLLNDGLLEKGVT